MLLKRLLCGVLAVVILAAAGYYGWTFRFFDRPLTAEAQKEFEEQVALPNNFTLAASVDSFESAKNSMESVREGVKSGSYALELNVAFNDKRVPYLADGPEYITDSSVPLEKVFKAYADQTYLRFILHLTTFPNPGKLYDLCRKYDLSDRILLTGFTMVDLDEHASTYGSFRLCMTVDPSYGDLNDEEVCEQLVQDAQDRGAAGLLCSAEIATESLRYAAGTHGQFRLLLCDADSDFNMYYAMSLNPDVIITTRPNELYNLMLSSDYLSIDRFNLF